MLIDELKKANIEAMKARDNDARAALSVVLTKYKLQEVEAKAQGKEIGDNECLSLIQKVLKELSDEKEVYSPRYECVSFGTYGTAVGGVVRWQQRIPTGYLYR